MAFDPVFLALAVPTVLLAGISKGGFGDVATFAATPLLTLAIDPAAALGLMLPLLMAMDLGALHAYRGRWHRPSVAALVLGALPGVALGALFWRIADADLLRLLIGAMSLAFVAFQLARAAGWLVLPPRPFVRSEGVGAGVVAGFTSFIAHAGGPAVAIFLLRLGLDKTAFQATAVASFWAINAFKAVPYGFLGIFTAETLLADAVLLPVAMLGLWLGVRAHRVIPERVFFAVTYLLLAAAGAKLVADALT